MFIQVQLLKGFSKPLLYSIPKSWHNDNFLGTIVHVPIRKNIIPALVIKQYKAKPKYCNFSIRDAHSQEPFPKDLHYKNYIEKLAHYYQLDSLHFIKRIRNFLTQSIKIESKTKELTEKISINNKKKIILTQEQQNSINFLTPKIKNQIYSSTVLHGVTGSGKTEIYKKLIERTIKQNKSAILMLPEVTLALQFEKLLKKQLSHNIFISGFHSGTTTKEKNIVWKKLLNEEPLLLIGVHLPILLPIPNLGLIIIDEEHDTNYQEKKHPKINSRQAAIIKANIYNIPILLGSATPSLESLYNIKNKNWHLLSLKNRFAGTFPKIEIAELSDKKYRRNFWISTKLEKELKNTLLKKEQAIIFLNRRGFSFFVQCKECSFLFECNNCSVSLTLHNKTNLKCHYCDHSMNLPEKCPECKSKKLIKKGIGTQQAVSILQKLLPSARIARADMDTTSKKKTWQETIKSFESGQLDILVGTQTITKGFHFPNVTLIGILWADLNLHFPIYNATENTLQQIIQVAGRAGRSKKDSKVIVQTMTNHHIFSFLNEINYKNFYKEEIKNRNLLGYPPCKRLVEIELKHINEEIVNKESFKIIQYLQEKANTLSHISILGPASPPIAKIKKIYSRKIYLKSPSIVSLENLFQLIDQSNYKSNIFYTPNPLN